MKSFLIHGQNLADAYAVTRTFAGSDKNAPDTYGIVRWRIWEGQGILLEATDTRSFSQCWVGLNENSQRPDADHDALFSVSDSANRLSGLLQHAARLDESVSVDVVEQQSDLPGLSKSSVLEFRLGDREMIRCPTIGTSIRESDGFFDNFTEEPQGSISLSASAWKLSATVKHVGPIDVSLGDGLALLTPVNSGLDFRAVLSTRATS